MLDILPVPVETLPATPDPSDHLPLVAEFSIGEFAPERAAPPRAPNPAADEPPVTRTGRGARRQAVHRLRAPPAACDKEPPRRCVRAQPAVTFGLRVALRAASALRCPRVVLCCGVVLGMAAR